MPERLIRRVAVHGHFYQPPREHPWLDVVEPDPSARPARDWNARVTDECYRPVTAARLLGPRDAIAGIVNTLDRISFNVGPTLFRWLDRERPEVARRIVDADRRSARRQGGHGNAIAQPYVHAILPLQSRRDRRTLIQWGRTEFRHRFGREPEGMWLPETAVDRPTLADLAEAGIRFTVLAPGQVARVRPRPGAPWRPAAQALDPRRPVQVDLGGGRSMVAFVYDGALAHAVAFGGILRSGEAFGTRLLAALGPEPPAGEPAPAVPRLAHMATDGESYGHHHRFGEMALAAAIRHVEQRGLGFSSYGAFLAAWPAGRPMAEAELVEPSAWSCAHGVERWRSDCGCRVGGPERHQRWRAPLREALDWLAGELDLGFESLGGALLKDPWAARDDYVGVVLQPAARDEILAAHALHPLDGGARVRALQLLEAERYRLLMFTSCAWFFDDVAGVEAVQSLRQAARAMDLLGAARGPNLEAGFRARLEAAPSNDAELPTAAHVYDRKARPAAVDFGRVAAQVALAGDMGRGGGSRRPTWRFGAFTVEPSGWQGGPADAAGWVEVTDEATEERRRFAVGLRAPAGASRAVAVTPAQADGRADPSGLLAGPDVRVHGVEALLSVTRERLVVRVDQQAWAGLGLAGAGVLDRALTVALEVPSDDEELSSGLDRAARLATGAEVARGLEALAVGDVSAALADIEAGLGRADRLGIAPELDQGRAREILQEALVGALGRLPGAPGDATAGVLSIVALARRLELALDLWEVQTSFAPWWLVEGDTGGPDQARAPGPDPALIPLAEALGFETPAGPARAGKPAP